MARAPGIRRFLRFSLRSLLLVTLVVAAWLGYEVQQARTVERQAEAIRALGGEVEFEPSPWSLLRFVEPQTYGRTIVVAEIAGERTDDTIPILKTLSALRELRIEYDGTFDLQPSWRALNRELTATRVVPINYPSRSRREPDLEKFAAERDSRDRRRYERFAEKSRQNKRLPGSLRTFIDAHLRSPASPELGTPEIGYAIVPLCDGSIAEVEVVSGFRCKLDKDDTLRGAILLVDDTCVDGKAFHDNSVDFSLRDIDADGSPDLAMEYIQSASRARYPPQRLRGDPRLWLGLYAIESTGFRSLLDDDLLKE